MIPVIVAVLASMLLLMALVGTFAVAGWRGERQRGRRLAEQLMVETRIEALTLQTLQAMRDAARGRWSTGSRREP